MPGVTATIITLNESANITAALESVSWADEIVVVDAGSTDDTVALARRVAGQVIVRDWPGYIAQKNFAASAATHDWILSLDADERVTPALAAEIQALLAGEPACPGYRVPRISYYLGRWIRSTDWYPDCQLRLYDRRRARWTGRYVHESVQVDGQTGRLRADLQHYPYTDVSHHLRTIDKYSTLAARQMYEDGRRTSPWRMIVHGDAAFLRNYIARGGFRDGAAGLIVSLLNSFYVVLKFVKLWELSRRSDADSR
ncbi:MAG: glycosyltransferase family 2 protein [Acidobacteria bacterium]|nr:glycosyltransferase family 2 protein [Acidobacteriota bacterium]